MALQMARNVHLGMNELFPELIDIVTFEFVTSLGCVIFKKWIPRKSLGLVDGN